MKKTIRLGTRSSPLALIQAEEIRRGLFQGNPGLASEADIEIIPIQTDGDWRPEHSDRRFIEMGGSKGLFTREIEEALRHGHVDMATHSMKDIASHTPPGLHIAAVTLRTDPRDAFISRRAQTLEQLPPGAVVGTSSLRRQAQILALRPDLRTAPLRGNIETRLKKVEDGMTDAAVLAVAGLARLDIEARISSIIGTATMLPAAAQGALGVEIREDDEDMRKLLSPLNHAASFACITAERAVMRALDGSCHTPAAAYATLSSGKLHLEALVARADGTNLLRLSVTGTAEDADKTGFQLGQELRGRSPADIFTS